MVEIKLPYHRGYMKFSIDEKRLNKVINSGIDEYKTDKSQEEIVYEALKNPIGSQDIGSMVKEANKILIITSDHTRPVPSRITLPVLLKEIRKSNIGARIKILIATGFHRPTSHSEMIDKFGKDIVETEELINHQPDEMGKMTYKGLLPSGGGLWLNSLIDWADITISEGFIEPHFFAGFSGGRKSILPGIASTKTIFANHCSEFIADRYAATGNLKHNPIHKDMLFAADKAKLRFILNVVINDKKEIINAFAGDHIKAHEKGCRFVAGHSNVSAENTDIVIVSNGGHPLDRNIYQAVKGMSAAESCVKEGGVIIMAAACGDGHGGDAFYRWFSETGSAKEIMDTILKIPSQETYPDQWQAQILARVMMKAKVILVTDMCDHDMIENMKMTHRSTIDEALKEAFYIKGDNARVNVIKDGVSVIINQ